MFHERAIIPDLIPVLSLSGLEFSDNRHNQPKIKRYLCPAQWLYSTRSNSCFSQNIYDSTSWQIFGRHYSDLKMTDQYSVFTSLSRLKALNFLFGHNLIRSFRQILGQSARNCVLRQRHIPATIPGQGTRKPVLGQFRKKSRLQRPKFMCQAKSSLRRLFLAWHGDTENKFLRQFQEI